MAVFAAVATMVAALVAVAGTVALCPPLSRAYRDTWRRVPPETRGLACFGIGMMVVGGIAGGVLLIVAPWGTKTVVWLILIGVPAWVLVWTLGVSVQTVMDGRRRGSGRRGD